MQLNRLMIICHHSPSLKLWLIMNSRVLLNGFKNHILNRNIIVIDLELIDFFLHFCILATFCYDLFIFTFLLGRSRKLFFACNQIIPLQTKSDQFLILCVDLRLQDKDQRSKISILGPALFRNFCSSHFKLCLLENYLR